MLRRLMSTLVVLVLGTTALAGCANTIRGVGRDAANTVDATQDAGSSVRHSVQKRR